MTTVTVARFKFAIPTLYRMGMGIGQFISGNQQAFGWKFAEEGIDPADYDLTELQDLETVYFHKASIRRGLLNVDPNSRAIYIIGSRVRTNQGQSPSYLCEFIISICTGAGDSGSIDKPGKYDFSGIYIETVEGLFQSIDQDQLRQILFGDWPVNVPIKQKRGHWPGVAIAAVSQADPDEAQGLLAQRIGAVANIRLTVNLTNCIDYALYNQ